MTTLNVSLPETLKDFVDAQVQMRGYNTSSNYISDLIRHDQYRQAEQRLAALILESLESGAAVPVSKSYWDNKRDALKQRHHS